MLTLVTINDPKLPRPRTTYVRIDNKQGICYSCFACKRKVNLRKSDYVKVYCSNKCYTKKHTFAPVYSGEEDNPIILARKKRKTQEEPKCIWCLSSEHPLSSCKKFERIQNIEIKIEKEHKTTKEKEYCIECEGPKIGRGEGFLLHFQWCSKNTKPDKPYCSECGGPKLRAFIHTATCQSK